MRMLVRVTGAVAVLVMAAGCNCSSDGGTDAAEADAGPDDAGLDGGAAPDAGTRDGGAADSGLDGGHELDAGAGDGGAGDAGIDAGCAFGLDGGLVIPDGGVRCVSTGTLPGTIYYTRAPSADAGLSGSIWVRSGDGLSDHLLTEGGRPALSPDGRWLGFSRNGPNGTVPAARGDVWVRDLETGAERKVFSNTDYVVYGGFTPDSGTFVFDFYCALETVNVDGTGLAAFPSFGGCYSDMPAVSPDGRSIALRNSQVRALGLEDFSGLNPRWLPTPQSGMAMYPRWSTNGEWLSYLLTAADVASGELHRVRPDGGDDLALTHQDVCGAPLVALSPSHWTPDDRWVITVGSAEGLAAIHAVASDGTGQVLRLCVSDGPPVDFVAGYTERPLSDGGTR